MAKRPTLSPLLAPPITEQADVSAMAALMLGTAEPDQQKRAREWILLRACRINSTTFDVDPIKSAFLQGRRQVGLMILAAAQTSPAAAALLENASKEGDQ